MAYNIYKMFGVTNLEIKINSLGSGNIREKYGNDLKKSLLKFKNEFNEAELIRLEKNPLRILDSKNKKIKKIVDENAPNIFNYISIEDNEHFNSVTDILNQLKIPYTHDQKLVRGLDYYTKTVFELVSSDLGAQDALCGGGRYNNLVQDLGGENIPAIGFADEEISKMLDFDAPDGALRINTAETSNTPTTRLKFIKKDDVSYYVKLSSQSTVFIMDGQTAEFLMMDISDISVSE